MRSARLDALRGAAIVWMAAFHLCFDLNTFRLLRPFQNFYEDPFWTVQRTCIVSLFLFCAGLGQAAALDAGQQWPRFWRRWAQVAGCALLVSAGSALMFPGSWISFGVLHGIALMLVATRFAAPLGAWLWPLGALAIALPAFVHHPFFDSRWTNWVGLVTRKPVTEDFVPLLPWLGVMLWGLAAGGWLLARRRALLEGALPAALKPLAWLHAAPAGADRRHRRARCGGHRRCQNAAMSRPSAALPALEHAVLREIAARGGVRHYPANAVIINENDAADSLFVILAGRVKVYASNAAGKEVILTTLGAGEYVGELALDGGPRSASVMTLEPTSCAVVTGANLREFIVAHPDFAQHLILNLIARVRRLTGSVKSLALDDVYSRVVGLLQSMAVEQGGQRVVAQRLTQQDIAEHVGSSREMVSRVFKELTTGGYVRVDGGRITILRTPPAAW
jgi:CRP-like cAMP-binding protein